MEELDAAVTSGIRNQLWLRGMPTEALLDAGQREWIDSFRKGQGHGVWMIGRQRGKTFAAVTMAVEFAVRTPGAVIRYAAQTAKSAEGIIGPTLRDILKDCPEELKPKVNEMKGTVTWPNDSVMTWAGTDNDQFDRLRGPKAHLILLDEAAFYAKLDEVEAALIPQLTTTGGKCLYLSTPPQNPSHLFVSRLNAAKARNMAQHDTLLTNPRLKPEGVERLLQNEAERLGLTLEEFRGSTYCRREYFAEIVTEESKAAVPSFTQERAKEVVCERVRPAHFDGYVAMDLGLIDGHGVLFGYWDYERARLVVEDEILLRGKATDILAEAVKSKETALWGNTRFEGTLFGAKDWGDTPEWLKGVYSEKAPRQPYLRVADNLLLVLADIHQRHGLAFFPTPKDDKHMAVDALDIAMRTGQVEIHPRCVNLIHQLYSTLWDNNRRQWERSSEGHGELVDCLVYLWRNVRKNRDPRPPQPVDQFWSQMQPKQTLALGRKFGR